MSNLAQRHIVMFTQKCIIIIEVYVIRSGGFVIILAPELSYD